METNESTELRQTCPAPIEDAAAALNLLRRFELLGKSYYGRNLQWHPPLDTDGSEFAEARAAAGADWPISFTKWAQELAVEARRRGVDPVAFDRVAVAGCRFPEIEVGLAIQRLRTELSAATAAVLPIGDPPTGDAPDGFLSANEFATRFDVTKGAAQKRLERHRETNKEARFTEVANRQARGPRYLYSFVDFRHLFADAASPSKRPPKNSSSQKELSS